MCDSIFVTIFEGGGDRACYNACTIWLFFFSICRQITLYLSIICHQLLVFVGSLRCWTVFYLNWRQQITGYEILYVCRWISASNFLHIGIDICCYICDERYFVNLLWMLNVYDSLCSLCEVYETKLILMFWSIFWKFNS